MRSKPAEDLLALSGSLFQHFSFAGNPFKLCLDGDFASDPAWPKPPEDAIKDVNIPVLVGTTENAGAKHLLQFLAKDDLFDEVSSHFDLVGPQVSINYSNKIMF